MTARLQQHEQLRRNMVNDVAHELRTPLTNLRASIEAIQDGLRRADGQVIDALHDDVLLLQRLVEDLQTLALAEAGKLPLHIEDVDLREELERFAAAQPDPRLLIRAEPGLVLPVDRVRLQQILSNLVRNALAHIEPVGKVEITASHESQRIIRLTVADDGGGIPASDLPFVFDRFYRTDASRTRSTGGAGLGLAIVRELVGIHGGKIVVESDEGRGSRFTLELPSVSAERGLTCRSSE
jgi:two-component system, OmpR family, sensor histidine kinase BaeS